MAVMTQTKYMQPNMLKCVYIVTQFCHKLNMCMYVILVSGLTKLNALNSCPVFEHCFSWAIHAVIYGRFRTMLVLLSARGSL